jgi:RNA polymerase sigma-70 factor (ECF subfamily)
MDNAQSLDLPAIAVAEEQPAESFEALVRRHGPAIYRLAYRMTGNEADAEDLTQDALLEALRAFGKFQPGTHFDRWIYRIMTRTFIDSVRWRRRHPAISLDLPDARPPVESGDSPDDAVIRSEAGQQVHRALATIPKEFRQAIVLVDLEGLSYEDAARVMDCAVGTVRSRLHRGRSLLRSRLRAYAQDTP